MRQLMLAETGRVAWAAQETPRLSGPGAALVRPIAAATCDFDHLLHSGAMAFPLPVPLGHEAVAVVEHVGTDVRTIAPGDLVVVPFQISCGTCASCVRGLTSACATVDWLACYGLGALSGSYGGLVADLVAVPCADAMLVPLPTNVSPASAASVSCNVVDAYRCVAPQLAARPGADVLVVGGAFANIALYSGRIAQALGAARISFFAQDEQQRSRASALGLDVLDDLNPDAHRYPITVDASMDPELLELAVRSTARGGTLTISTMYADPGIRLPLMTAFKRCLTITTGQPHARALAAPVLDLMASGELHLDDVTTTRTAWADAPDAFAAGHGKTVLIRDA